MVAQLTADSDRTYSDTTLAVMSYTTAAVSHGYRRHPDVEIRAPGPYFAEMLHVILTALTDPHDDCTAPTADPLPARPVEDDDVAAFHTRTPDPDDTRADPLGVKGIGEVVRIGVASAIANAVFQRHRPPYPLTAPHRGVAALKRALRTTERRSRSRWRTGSPRVGRRPRRPGPGHGAGDGRVDPCAAAWVTRR